VSHDPTPYDEPTADEMQTFLPDPRVRWGLPDVLLGLGAFIFSLVLGTVVAILLQIDVDNVDAVGLFSFASALLSYAAITAVVVVASRRKGLGTLAADFGLRFRPVDIAIGLGIAVAAKLVAVVIGVLAISATGHTPESGNFELSVAPLWIVLNGFLVAVVVAPFVEELFFRGLVLRAVKNRVLRRGGTAARAAVSAIVASSLGFAALHLYQSPDVTLLIILGGSTLFLGLANSRVTLSTGRLGAAIIAHALYNGSSIVIALLGS
jgi:membrane protease YdiL (CAAX protease family)